MSAKIIQFPTEPIRDWVAMERVIRDILAMSACDVSLHEAVVAEMKLVFESIPARLEFQISSAELAIAQGLEAHAFAEFVGGWLRRTSQTREEAILGAHLRLCVELVQLRAILNKDG